MAIRGRKAAAASLAVVGLGLGQLPASAAPRADDHVKPCIDGWNCKVVYLEGWIKWGNRRISGDGGAFVYSTRWNDIRD